MSAGEGNRSSDDERLETLFRPLNAPRPDDGFTDVVMRRVGRDLRLRRLVLGSATVVGLALSVVPVSAGVTALWQGLGETRSSAPAAWSALAAADPGLTAVWLLLLIAPVAARWLAR